MSTEHAILAVVRRSLTAAEFPDGTLTLNPTAIEAARRAAAREAEARDRREAEAEARRRTEAETRRRAKTQDHALQHQRRELLKAFLAGGDVGLAGTSKHLRHELGQANTRTPGRVERLWECLIEGAISPARASELVATGRVNDAAWAVIQGLGADPTENTPQPVADQHQLVADQPIVKMIVCWSAELHTASGRIPVQGFDPLKNRDAQPSAQAIVSVLNRLASEGWEIVHLSEDRAIDDVASVAVVVESRYLLTRRMADAAAMPPSA